MMNFLKFRLHEVFDRMEILYHFGNISFPLAERGRSDREEYFEVASENVGLCILHTPLPFAQDDTLIIFVRRQMFANAVQTDSRDACHTIQVGEGLAPPDEYAQMSFKWEE